MRPLAAVLAAGGLLASCGGQGLTGWFPTEPGSGYGFDFRGDGTFFSRVGGDVAKGTYTVDGKRVTICFGAFCRDLNQVGDCLIDTTDGGSYCRDSR